MSDVPIDLFLNLGGFEDDLFIDHVDTELAFRVQAHGYRLYGIPQAVFRNCMGDAMPVHLAVRLAGVAAPLPAPSPFSLPQRNEPDVPRLRATGGEGLGCCQARHDRLRDVADPPAAVCATAKHDTRSARCNSPALGGPVVSHEEQAGTWSRGALDTVDRCPACGSGKRDARRYSRHDDAGIMPDIWHIVGCADCGSLYLDPRPDAESLPRAYLDYYTHHAEPEEVPQDGAGGLVWSLVHGYLNHRFGMRRTPSNKLGALVFSAIEPLRLKLDYYGRHLTRRKLPKPGRLLDVGCGNGAFLMRAREMGWEVAGCEPDAKAVAACQAQGLDVIHGDVFHTALDVKPFDVVTISHVLEHVTDQRGLLNRVHLLLRTGGVLWVAVPNPESFGLHIFGSAWRGLHVPFHLCIPSQEELMFLVRSAKFCAPKIMRRGAHSQWLWSDSAVIARRERVGIPPRQVLNVARLLTDFLSAFTPRFAEETVIIAHKPEASDVG